jgi:hypothetical protein
MARTDHEEKVYKAEKLMTWVLGQNNSGELDSIDWTEIPRADTEMPGPCWIPAVDLEGKPVKPQIVCRCNMHHSISLHHVHADGRVTRSFWHRTIPGLEPSECNGCGWHVWLKLKDYDRGEFPPGTR